MLSFQHFDVHVGSMVTPVKVFTDNNTLAYINKMRNCNQHLVHWSLALQEYNLEIEQIQGQTMLL